LIVAGWGLCSIGIGHKHYYRKLPASKSVVVACGWIPKEDYQSFWALLVTFFTILEDAGGGVVNPSLCPSIRYPSIHLSVYPSI